MAQLTRIKRRLLREAVSENLATMRGLPPPALRRHRRYLPRAVRIAVLGGILLTVASSTYVLSRVGGQGPELIYVPLATEVLAARDPWSGGGRLEPEPMFTAPVAVDRGLFVLPVSTVVIDPGHGGENEGTTGSGDLVEKDVTLDIALRLRDLLEDDLYEVVLTRDEDREINLEERARLANEQGGDIFVSIHVNWLPDRQARGLETFYLGATDDPVLSQIVARENLDSGFSLGDLRRLLEGMYTDVRRDESRRLAEAVHQELMVSLRRVNPAIGNRGVKTAPFVVLIATEMPAILAEVSCLSHGEEVRLLQQDSYRQEIAEALHNGIRSYAYAVNGADYLREES